MTNLLPYYYSFITVYTLLGTIWFDFARKTPFSFTADIKNEAVITASFVMFIAIGSYMIGTLFVRRTKKRFSETILISLTARRFIIILNVFTCLIFIIGVGTNKGVPAFILSDSYASSSNLGSPLLLKIHRLLIPVSIILIPLVKNNTIRTVLICTHCILFFGVGTRLLTLALILYGLTTVILNRRRFSILSGFCTLCLGLISMVVVLAIRIETPFGILPNFWHAMSLNGDFSLLLYALNYSSSFSVLGLAYSIENSVKDTYAYLVSISPLPLEFHDGNRMLKSQRLIGTAPMSSLAINYTMGLHVVVLFYFVLGYLIARLEKATSTSSVLHYFMVFSIMFLSILLSVQYNLRSFIRLIELLLIVHFAFILFRRVKL